MSANLSNWLVYRDFPLNDHLDPYIEEMTGGEHVPVHGKDDIDAFLKEYIGRLDFSKTGILLSGGVDSALVASYCPPGTLAFTISYPELREVDEVEQAKKYAQRFGLRLIEVPVTFQDVLDLQDDLMLFKKEPLSAIEIAIHKMCLRALDFGLEKLLTGAGADTNFGGLTRIMSREWTKEDFIKGYSFCDPRLVLKPPQNPNLEFFDKYERRDGTYDAIGFMGQQFGKATSKYFCSASRSAGIKLLAPFELMDRRFELNVEDMKNGHEKRVLRDLFAERSGIPSVPRKYPLPRPLEVWKNHFGPIINEEFYPDAYERCPKNEQRWLVYTLDHWLYLYKNNCFKHYDVAYTTGVYDMFHMGHLNILRRASKMCDKLVVGVTSDELVSYKNKKSIIRFEDRIRIVRALPFVYKAVEQSDMDKVKACKKYGAHAIVVGDDWKNTDKWNKYETDLKAIGAEVVYLPYTKRVSSTLLREELKNGQ